MTKYFQRFRMARKSPKISHLSSVDDMIMLCKAEVRTMQMIDTTLDKYGKVSGQKVIKDKIVIYFYHIVTKGDVVMAEVAIGILRKEFPLTYLGYPIFYRKIQKTYYHQRDWS